MKNLIFMLLTFVSTQVHARTDAHVFEKGFVQIRPGQRLYVEYRKAAPGKTTIFLENGLTWSTTQWKPLVDALDKIDPSIGIVLYDMVGMGKTLLDKAPVNYDIPFENQVKDLKDLYDTLKIQGPLVLSGLSYGGAVAIEYLSRYPNDFGKVIAMAPFLEKLPDQDKWILQSIAATRQMFPFNPASDEELYDYFLRQLVYTTYPMQEPIMLENPYKTEGVFRMVKGAKTWRAADAIANLPAGKLHLMAGAKDPFVQLPWLQNFWQALPVADRASFIIYRDTEHKLPEIRPDFTAAWVNEIINNNPAIKGGLVFDGDPVAGVATSGSIVIPLHKESACETILRKVFRSF
ncbi:MAG: alpha/beta fold hydrolase [Bdellovibrionales bacterium]